MPEHAIHCPFLNRSEARCSSHFSLDRLNDAFEQCMGTYQSCPVYLELLAERRQRRHAAAQALQSLRPGELARLPSGDRFDGRFSHHRVTIVPLTLAGNRPPSSHA